LALSWRKLQCVLEGRQVLRRLYILKSAVLIAWIKMYLSSQLPKRYQEPPQCIFGQSSPHPNVGSDLIRSLAQLGAQGCGIFCVPSKVLSARDLIRGSIGSLRHGKQGSSSKLWSNSFLCNDKNIRPSKKQGQNREPVQYRPSRILPNFNPSS